MFPFSLTLSYIGFFGILDITDINVNSKFSAKRFHVDASFVSQLLAWLLLVSILVELTSLYDWDSELYCCLIDHSGIAGKQDFLNFGTQLK